MPKQLILDSHVHLWPSSATNSQSHAWMHDGDHLAKRYSVVDYFSGFSSSFDEPSDYEMKGFVYVETDRRYRNELYTDEDGRDFEWAKDGPCKELEFLRRVVEGTPEDDEEFDEATGKLMKGCVLWAPLDKGFDIFNGWLSVVNEQLPREWVKGFRFLLQGVRDKVKFEKLVTDPGCVEILRYMGERGWSFDIGVDQRQGGNWQLEMIPGLIERVHEGVEDKDKTVFILNHLCKPDMEQPAILPETRPAFERWKASMVRLGACDKVYMKLSGGFSEIADQDPARPWPVAKLVERMRPWLGHVFQLFTPQRIMFGSDWPVCNVRGPGDNKAWKHWRAVVEASLEEQGFSDQEKDRIWYGTAAEIYKLEIRA